MSPKLSKWKVYLIPLSWSIQYHQKWIILLLSAFFQLFSVDSSCQHFKDVDVNNTTRTVHVSSKKYMPIVNPGTENIVSMFLYNNIKNLLHYTDLPTYINIMLILSTKRYVRVLNWSYNLLKRNNVFYIQYLYSNHTNLIFSLGMFFSSSSSSILEQHGLHLISHETLIEIRINCGSRVEMLITA